MNFCPVCGYKRKPEDLKCPVCGTYFPVKEISSQPAEVSVPEPISRPISQPAPVAPPPSENPKTAEDSWEKGKYNRIAIAGFVLSLMGAATFVTSPLQLMALILCLASEKADRFLKLRRIGLVLSAVFLILSLAFWIVVALNFDTLSQLIYSSSEYFNEFYY